MTPEEIVARLIYRDGLMLVIDKPAGLAVHKGPKGGESLEDYFGALRFGLPRSPALEPLTGRTHQLRVHCAAMGWPILGDSVYGGAPRTGGPGLSLHAREIVVPLYKNRAPIRVSAAVPSHMQQLLRACGWPGDALAR